MALDAKSRLAAAAAAAAVAMWLLAGLWHSLIAATIYARETGATHEGTGIIFLAYAVLATLMAILYRRGYTGDHPLRQGASLGAVVGVLWVFPHELAMAGAHGEPLGYVLFNGAWHVIEQGVGGVVLAFVARAERL